MPWDWKSAFDRKKPGPSRERLAIAAGVLAIAAAGAAATGALAPEEGMSIVQGPPEGERPVVLAPSAPAPMADAAAAAQPGPERPPLEYRQGRVFGYLLPRGWRVNESGNGIEIVAPDGVTAVVASIVLGAAGRASPEGYLRDNLARVGQPHARFVSVRPAESWPGPTPDFTWRGIEAEIESRQNGTPIHIRATSHVLQGAGQYAAIVTGAQSPRERWDVVRHWLPRVRDGIRLVNAAVPGASMAAGLPRGIRHDEIYGTYNQAWTARQVPAADLSQARREGTMGYVRLVDPQTGRVWELPLEAYDASAGGYRNPVRPGELLQKAPS